MKIMSPLKLSAVLIAAAAGFSTLSAPSAMAEGAYGPDTCKNGFVWREAFPDDTVCVTPAERSKARRQNQRHNLRKNPSGGAYGPNTCRQGYVWRDAQEGDQICVTPGERDEAARQNALAPSRYENAD